jgi:hypothetical protein
MRAEVLNKPELNEKQMLKSVANWMKSWLMLHGFEPNVHCNVTNFFLAKELQENVTNQKLCVRSSEISRCISDGCRCLARAQKSKRSIQR